MKFDKKKKNRLIDKLETITLEEIGKGDFVWLPVSRIAKKENITVQRVLQKIKEGKYDARSLWGSLIVIKQNSKQKECKNGAINS